MGLLKLQFNGMQIRAKRAPISMENYNDCCVECGQASIHMCDLIQYGFAVDMVRSVFECTECEAQFYFEYDAYTQSGDRYILNNTALTGDQTHT